METPQTSVDPLDNSNMQLDICRVCRLEGTPEQPLFYPCRCSGSIKYVHQECLLEWLRHSRKKYCELCKHSYSFTPSKFFLWQSHYIHFVILVYRDHMPRRLPLWLVLWGIVRVVARGVSVVVKTVWLSFLWTLIMPLMSSALLPGHQASLVHYLYVWILEDKHNVQLPILWPQLGKALIIGWAVTGAMVITFLALLLLQDYMASHGLLRLRARRRRVRDEPSESLEDLNENVNMGREPPNQPTLQQNPKHDEPDEDFMDEGVTVEPLGFATETIISETPTFALSEQSTSRRGTTWLNEVSPREYRAYLRRRELYKERLRATQLELQGETTVISDELGKESLLPRIIEAEPSTSGISSRHSINHSSHGIRELGSTSRIMEGRRLLDLVSPSGRSLPLGSSTRVTFRDDYRCKICKSSTCIKKEHVISASKSQQNGRTIMDLRVAADKPVEVSHNGFKALTNNMDFSINDMNASINTNIPINNVTTPVSISSPINPLPTTTRLNHTVLDAQPVNEPVGGEEEEEEDNDDENEQGRWNLFLANNEGQPMTFGEFVGIEGGVILGPLRSMATVLFFNAAFLFAFVLLPRYVASLVLERSMPLLALLMGRLQTIIQTEEGFLLFIFKAISQAVLFISRHRLVGMFQKVCLPATHFIASHAQLFVIAPDSVVAFISKVLMGQVILLGMGSLYVIFRISQSPLSSTEKTSLRVFLILKGFIRLVMVMTMELILFPIYCGWLIDYCCSDLVSYDRLAFFAEYPRTSHFLHWTVGLLVLLLITLQLGWLRKVLRPGLLYFIRNAEDPEYLPLKEAVESPLPHHAMRVLISSLLYGIFIGWFVGGFSILCRLLMPRVIPLNFDHRDSLREIPYDILGQIFAKAVFGIVEPTQVAAGVRTYLRLACRLLGIQSFFYGGRYRPEEMAVSGRFVYVPDRNRRYRYERLARMSRRSVDPVDLAKITIVEDIVIRPSQASEALSTSRTKHQPLPLDPVRPGRNSRPTGSRNSTRGFTVVYRPDGLPWRIIMFLWALWLMAQTMGLIWIMAPVLLGRLIYRMLLPPERTVMDIHAFYLGFLALSLILKALQQSIDVLIRHGLSRFLRQLVHLPIFLAKSLIVLATILVVWPLLFGFYCMIVLTPLLISLDETFIFPPFMCWFTGLILVHMIWTAREALLPERRLIPLRRLATLSGWWEMDLTDLIIKVLAPYTLRFLILIGAPPLTILLLAPLFQLSSSQLYLLQRWSHLISLAIPAVVLLLYLGMQFREHLVRRIRDDNFLVGERLLNLEVSSRG